MKLYYVFISKWGILLNVKNFSKLVRPNKKFVSNY